MLYRVLKTSRLSLLKSHLHLDGGGGGGNGIVVKNEPSSSSSSSSIVASSSSRPRSQIFYQPSTRTTSSSSSSWTRLPTSLTRTMSTEQNKICLKDSNSDSPPADSKIEQFNSSSNVSCSKGIVLLHLSKENTFDPRKLDFSTLTLPKSN